jgi:hypothetical protein
MEQNALQKMRPQAAGDSESLKARVEDLENKVEDMEMILAGLLPLPRRRSGSLVSWLRTLVQAHRNGPGSTIAPG